MILCIFVIPRHDTGVTIKSNKLVQYLDDQARQVFTQPTFASPKASELNINKNIFVYVKFTHHHFQAGALCHQRNQCQ